MLILQGVGWRGRRYGGGVGGTAEEESQGGGGGTAEEYSIKVRSGSILYSEKGYGRGGGTAEEYSTISEKYCAKVRGILQK